MALVLGVILFVLLRAVSPFSLVAGATATDTSLQAKMNYGRR
jgi:hypothetical protein